jgi:lysophospholipase L1-like esterase
MFESLEGRTLLAATRIMPLGDSITESSTGHASYRYWLWKSLQQASYDVDFIGSKVGVANGPPLFSDFDQDHEGHSGFRADQLRDSTTAWATANRPDIVLLHAGTNDLVQAQSVSSTSSELGQIIDLLRGVNANVTILLAKIIPISGNNQVTQLNSSIGTLAASKNTAQSRVIAVDQYTGFSVTGDLYDGIHPNQSGEQKMSAKWYSTLTSVLPAPQPPQPPSGTVYLSNLNWTSATNGNGPVEKDKSSGEQAAGDGRTITLNGVTYAKGLGVHANSDVRYNLAGQYTTFLSDVGIDDEVGGGGSVKFQVFLDGATTPAYDSGAIGGNSATKQINLNVTGKTTLRLVVTDNADGNAYDHADWANARIVASGTPVSPPAAPTGLGATLAGTQSAPQINLAWTDAATDETGYKVERRTGTGGAWGEIASLGAGATSYSDSSNLSFSTTYFYRVYAINGGGSSGFSNEANATTPAAPPPPPPPTGTTFLSDLNWTSATNGNGPVEKDKSSGEQFAGDGRTITLNGVTYTKGLGVHASSDIRYNLAGQYASFLSDVGVDDEVGGGGSVRFQVFLDGATTAAYDSGAMGGNSATKQINLDVTGRTTLRLVVTDNADGNAYDHADWANARLLVSGTPVTPPAAPTNLTASFASNRVNLAWTDLATDETGYKVERKTGTGGAWAEIASLAAGAASYPDAANLLPGTTYFYRVYAVKNGTPSAYSNEASALVPAPAGQTYLSDLNWVSATNGNGPVERDTSSGERFAGDGHTIRIGGQSYTKGLGVHANSTIVYNLGGAYQTFASDIGIDDETGGDGSVAFQVWVDGVKVYDSGRVLGGVAARSVAINVAGAQELKLVVTDSGDGDAYDHADWASARLAT